METFIKRPDRTGRLLPGVLETFSFDQAIERLQNDAEYVDKGHKALTLLKDNTLQTVIMCIRQGQSLPEHPAPGPFTLTILRGRINFVLEPQGENIATELVPGQLLVLEEPRVHEVNALEESAFLLTIVSLKAATSK